MAGRESELSYLIGSAGIVALCSGHWRIMPIHMLSAACRIGSARIFIRSQGIDPERVYAEAESAIDSIPRDETPPQASYFGPEALKVMERAEKLGGMSAECVVRALVEDETDAAGFLLKHHFKIDPRRAA